MKLLDDYFTLQKQIYDYFGYVEDWCIIPLEDCREYYWYLWRNFNGSSYVLYNETVLTNEVIESGYCYNSEVYKQRFLPRWVYRGGEYTMICTDPHTDGNKFLSVFDNSKEIKKLT